MLAVAWLTQNSKHFFISPHLVYVKSLYVNTPGLAHLSPGYINDSRKYHLCPPLLTCYLCRIDVLTTKPVMSLHVCDLLSTIWPSLHPAKRFLTTSTDHSSMFAREMRLHDAPHALVVQHNVYRMHPPFYCVDMPLFARVLV